jgi:hypothetical protein
MNVDTSAVAVERQAARFDDMCGLGTSDYKNAAATLRALAAERDALVQHRAAAQASVQSIEAQAASLWGRVQAAEAERDRLAAENARLVSLLRRIEEAATDTPTAESAERALSAIYEWAVAALTQEPSND